MFSKGKGIDKKYFIFGEFNEDREELHLLGRCKRLLREALDGLLSAAEVRAPAGSLQAAAARGARRAALSRRGTCTCWVLGAGGSNKAKASVDEFEGILPD